MNVPGNARFGTFCEPSSENSDSALCRFDRASRFGAGRVPAPNAIFCFLNGTERSFLQNLSKVKFSQRWVCYGQIDRCLRKKVSEGKNRIISKGN